jgi:hypothetical protein
MELEKSRGLHHGERVEREPIRGSGALKISRGQALWIPTIPTLAESCTCVAILSAKYQFFYPKLAMELPTAMP